MAGYENIKDKGFDKRTTGEQREIARMGGKASGETRRRKADLREAANLLLTTEIDHPEWTETLKGMGLESTMEYAIVAAMARESLKGNVSAYRALKETIGQTDKSEIDLKEREIAIELLKAQKEKAEAEARIAKNKADMMDANGKSFELLESLVNAVEGKDD